MDIAGPAATYMVSELWSGRLCSGAIHTGISGTQVVVDMGEGVTYEVKPLCVQDMRQW